MRLPERVVDFSGDVLWLQGPTLTTTTSLGKQKQAAATVIVIVVVVIVVVAWGLFVDVCPVSTPRAISVTCVPRLDLWVVIVRVCHGFSSQVALSEAGCVFLYVYVCVWVCIIYCFSHSQALSLCLRGRKPRFNYHIFLRLLGNSRLVITFTARGAFHRLRSGNHKAKVRVT